MYYALIFLTTIMFGGCFALNDIFRKIRGSSIRISLEFSLISSVAGMVVLFLINGFNLEFTPFTLITALLATVCSLALTFCTFKALDRINLSAYSLFSMLGGMVLPFLQGIIFYDEKMTLTKWLCLILITAALFLTVEKGERKKGAIYYALVFILNGTWSVCSKYFTEADFAKTSTVGYSNLICICTIVISAVLLLTVYRRKPYEEKCSLKGIAVGAAVGILNKIANLILLIALIHVEASVQYPMVTGGVMIVSTFISLFGAKKPSKKEILSVFVAFVGLFLLFAIPT